jgi:hypothetical protein
VSSCAQSAEHLIAASLRAHDRCAPGAAMTWPAPCGPSALLEPPGVRVAAAGPSSQPPSQIATLHQRETGDVFRLACSPECAGALRMAEGPVTVKVVTRQVELAGKGRAFKLRVVGVVGSGEAP